jgi:hypothetical protein
MIRQTQLLIALLLLLLPIVARAQKKMDSFDLHVASLRVLERKDVQAELVITPAQRNKMDKFATDYNDHLNAYLAELKKQKKVNQPMPDQTVIMMLSQLKQDVMGVLSADQLKRLREISLQAFGLNGILDKVVAKKVGLNDDQINRMANTYKTGSKKANDLVVNAIKPVQNQFKKKPKDKKEAEKMQADYLAKSKSAMKAVEPNVQKVNNDTQSAMLAIFTPQQRQAYLALQGKVFEPKSGSLK